jgi:hypothetical protein
MPEAVSFGTVATVVVAAGAGTAVVAVPALAALGIDGYRVGAGLLGCIVVQLFVPPEEPTPWRITATALGSVLVASFGAPYISPLFAIKDVVPAEHATAVASALLGGSAKPIVLLGKARFEKWFAAWLPGAGSKKGPEDA